MYGYWSCQLVACLLLILLPGWGEAAQLQYRTDTNRVTGFTRHGTVPAASGHATVTVDDNFLQTVVGPSGCQGVRDILSRLTITSFSPVVATVDAGVQCFNGVVVTSKASLDEELLKVVRTRLPEFRAYVAEQCPVVDVTTRCQRFRAVAQRLDPSADEIDTLIQQALTIRSQLP